MTTAPVASDARDVLTQLEAEARQARVSAVAYTLHLELTRGAATYRGDATIQFALTGSGESFLDFRGQRSYDNIEKKLAVSVVFFLI